MQRVARLHTVLDGGGHVCSPEELGAAVRADAHAGGRRGAREPDRRRAEGPLGGPGRRAGDPGRNDPVRAGRASVRGDHLRRRCRRRCRTCTPRSQAMQQAGYRLAVICNTGMVGGRVLREVLKRHGLFDFFDVTVFSNEFGVSKPHPSIFQHTLWSSAGSRPTRRCMSATWRSWTWRARGGPDCTPRDTCRAPVARSKRTPTSWSPIGARLAPRSPSTRANSRAEQTWNPAATWRNCGAQSARAC